MSRNKEAALLDEETKIPRRGLLPAVAATTALIAVIGRVPAWAGDRPPELDDWARRLVALNDRLRRHEIGVTVWQEDVAALNRSVPVADLVRYLDVDRLTLGFRYASALAEFADPTLPAVPLGAASQPWFLRVFGLRKGGAIIPHVHNNMVSAHLVISGSFHVRTYDRMRDAAEAALLRPAIDRVLGVGEIITMSDQRENAHWLVAQEDRSMTLDVGLVGLPASWRYGRTANSYNMIYVDPDRLPERDGLIAAPVLSFEACARRFAAG